MVTGYSNMDENDDKNGNAVTKINFKSYIPKVFPNDLALFQPMRYEIYRIYQSLSSYPFKINRQLLAVSVVIHCKI